VPGPTDQDPNEMQDIRKLFARSGKRPTRRLDVVTAAVKEREAQLAAAREAAARELAEAEEHDDPATAAHEADGPVRSPTGALSSRSLAGPVRPGAPVANRFVVVGNEPSQAVDEPSQAVDEPSQAVDEPSQAVDEPSQAVDEQPVQRRGLPPLGSGIARHRARARLRWGRLARSGAQANSPGTGGRGGRSGSGHPLDRGDDRSPAGAGTGAVPGDGPAR
jgi:hypothetical protein